MNTQAQTFSPKPAALAALFRNAPPAKTPARSTDEQTRRFDDAFTLFELGRWPQAYELLSGLADAGDAQAARLALLMARRGSALFGGRYAASAERRRRWAALAG